jgi:two-component system chemotaxis response regulator CheB
MDTSKRLLIVDDSRFMRQAIADFFSQDETIEVIGEAKNGAEAIEAVANLQPDVVTLDVNMPVMDGLTALKHLMIRSPLPTIMLSTLMKEGAQATFDALRYGALDFILKPSQLKGDLEQQRQEICRKVRLAAHVEVSAMRYIRAVPQDKPSTSEPCRRVVIFGAAEGGYSVLLKVVPHLILETPRTAYVIVLYADPVHTDVFAKYLDQFSAVRVRRVHDGERMQSGVCYLSSGSEYVTFIQDGDDLALHVTEAPFPWRRGSINRLLFSASEVLGSQSVAVLLSGAGDDGAEGLSEVMDAGGVILVQDPKTCLDKEMALNALDLCEFGCQTVPDGALGDTINELLN